MTNDKQFLQTFKDECRKYFTYEADLKKEKLELEEIEAQIINVRSPITNRVGGHQTTPPEDLLVTLIEVKTEVENRIVYYETIIQWLKDVFEGITSPAYKAIAWQTLIQAKNRTDILIYYDVDPDYVYRIRDKFLLIALSDDRKKEYTDIQSLKNKSKWLSLADKVTKEREEGKGIVK